MNNKTNWIAQVNQHLSTVLVCAGGAAGIADLASHQNVWWGALGGAFLGIGLSLLNRRQNRAQL